MDPYKKLKYTEESHKPERKSCTDRLLKLLRKEGFKTSGSMYTLERILTSKGFGLPVKYNEHFVFTVKGKYTRMYLNYVDALANEILLLRELKLI